MLSMIRNPIMISEKSTGVFISLWYIPGQLHDYGANMDKSNSSK